MIEHLRGREKALEPLGWTGREAEWIALVCLHSGIFTRAQFCFYFNPACTGLPDVRAPARLSSRNPLAQARNRNLTSSGPQDWGPDPTNHSTHLGPSFLSLPRTTPLPPRLESPELQLAFPSSPEKPLPTLIQAQICLKFTPQTTQTPRQPIFFANPPVTPARFRVGPLLESFFNTELRFLHNPG